MAAQTTGKDESAAPASGEGRRKLFGRKKKPAPKPVWPDQPVQGPRMTGWLLAAGLVLMAGGALSLNLIPGLDRLLGTEPAVPGVQETAVATGPGAASSFQGGAEAGGTTDAGTGAATGQVPPVGSAGSGQDEDTASGGGAAVPGQTGSAAAKEVAELYDAMIPSKAGPLLAAMDPDQAVTVLRLMKREQAAAALAQMDPGTGAELVRRMMTNP